MQPLAANAAGTIRACLKRPQESCCKSSALLRHAESYIVVDESETGALEDLQGGGKLARGLQAVFINRGSLILLTICDLSSSSFSVARKAEENDMLQQLFGAEILRERHS